MVQSAEIIYNEIPEEFNFDNDAVKFDRIKYYKGEVIFKEDSFPVGVYFIRKGKVKIWNLKWKNF